MAGYVRAAFAFSFPSMGLNACRSISLAEPNPLTVIATQRTVGVARGRDGSETVKPWVSTTTHHSCCALSIEQRTAPAGNLRGPKLGRAVWQLHLRLRLELMCLKGPLKEMAEDAERGWIGRVL